jgi:predicted MFS family arabinose efflux permease
MVDEIGSTSRTGSPSTFDGIVILLATILPALVFVGLSPILPQIEAHFSGEPGARVITRLLVSVVGPTVIVGAPVAGLLAERFGARRVIIWAALIFGSAGCLAAVLDNLYTMLASRIILGLALAATSTLSTVILTKIYTGEARNRWLGYYGTTGGVATLLLIPFCGYLGGFGWRLVFLSHALAFPLALLFILRLPRDHVRPRPALPGELSGGRGRPPTPWILIALGLACGALSGSPNLYMPFYLASLGVSDPSTMGLLLLPVALAGTLSALGFGRLRRRLSAWEAFVLILTLMTAGLTMISMANNVTVVVTGLTLLGLGGGLVVPNLFAVAASIGSEMDRSRLFGLTKGAYFAGPLLSQLALEPIAKLGTPVAPISALGLMGGLLLFWSLALVRSERRVIRAASLL